MKTTTINCSQNKTKSVTKLRKKVSQNEILNWVIMGFKKMNVFETFCDSFVAQCAAFLKKVDCGLPIP